MIKLDNIDCLYCKKSGVVITDPDKIEKTTDNKTIIRPMICTKCGKHWKDFYGANNDSSPILSVQRNSSVD